MKNVEGLLLLAPGTWYRLGCVVEVWFSSSPSLPVTRCLSPLELQDSAAAMASGMTALTPHLPWNFFFVFFVNVLGTPNTSPGAAACLRSFRWCGQCLLPPWRSSGAFCSATACTGCSDLPLPSSLGSLGCSLMPDVLFSVSPAITFWFMPLYWYGVSCIPFL